MEIIEEKFIGLFGNLLPGYSGEPLLVSVSGGIDSIVCAYIFKKFNYPISIAHCNFQLRKKDSDADATFVKKWAAKNKIPYFEKKFNVKKSTGKGQSIQMIARDLRYQWFYELAAKEGFAHIVTAHHLNDSIETSLMNMIRGTGISGLTGIPAVNGKVVRPMLHIFKEEIERYAKKEKINFRLDKSNLTTKYKRNKIRHQLIPLLTKYNPNFLEVFAGNLDAWQNISKVYRQAVARLRTELVQYDELMGAFKISVLELMARGVNDEILFELVSEFGFNSSQATQIFEAIHHQPGKKFYSKEHVLLIDRLFIIIKAADEVLEISGGYEIEDNFPFENESWKIGLLETKKLETLHTGPNEMLLDYKQLDWPIQIRRWKSGDKFTPMGMKGKKKVSDFLTDLKTDRFRKDDTWLIETAKGKIAGVIGFRPDEKFKISKNSKLCIYVKRKSVYF